MEIPPLSLEQLKQSLARKRRPTQFFCYKDLPDDPAELAFILISNPPRFLFHEANASGDIGHWTALRRNGHDICWFSSYGFMPDGELMITPSLRTAPGQVINKMAAALELLRQRGFKIHYSAIPLQTVNNPTATCGLWCLMFLTAKINNFEEFEDRLASISNPDTYAAAIYKKEYGSA